MIPSVYAVVELSDYNFWALNIWKRYYRSLSPEGRGRFEACVTGIKADIRRTREAFLRSGPSLFVLREQEKLDRIMPRSPSASARAKSRARKDEKSSSHARRRHSSERREVWYECGVCSRKKGEEGCRLRKQADVRDHAIREHNLEPGAWRDAGPNTKVSYRHRTAAPALIELKTEAYRRKKEKDLAYHRDKSGPSPRPRGRPRASVRSRSPRLERASTRRREVEERSGDESGSDSSGSRSRSRSESPPPRKREKKHKKKHGKKRKSSRRSTSEESSSSESEGSGAEEEAPKKGGQGTGKTTPDEGKDGATRFEDVSDPETPADGPHQPAKPNSTDSPDTLSKEGQPPPPSGSSLIPPRVDQEPGGEVGSGGAGVGQDSGGTGTRGGPPPPAGSDPSVAPTTLSGNASTVLQGGEGGVGMIAESSTSAGHPLIQSASFEKFASTLSDEDVSADQLVATLETRLSKVPPSSGIVDASAPRLGAILPMKEVPKPSLPAKATNDDTAESVAGSGASRVSPAPKGHPSRRQKKKSRQDTPASRQSSSSEDRSPSRRSRSSRRRTESLPSRKAGRHASPTPPSRGEIAVWIETQPYPWIKDVILRQAQLHFQPPSAASREALCEHIMAALFWWRVAATRLSYPPDGSGLNVPLLQKMSRIL